MRGSNIKGKKKNSKNGRGISNVNGVFKSDGDCCNALLLQLDVSSIF